MPRTTRSRPLLGIMFMLAAMAILPVIDVFAKMLGQAGMPILIVVWARALFGGLMTLPFALKSEGLRAFRPAQPLRQLLRAVLLLGATFLFFSALKYLLIADALAIFFVNPLVIVILSALLLRERVGPRRWAAVAVGFIGTLIIIRPGMVQVNPGTLLALGSGVALGSYLVLTRAMAGAADAMVLNFQTSAIGAALMALALPLLWEAPTPMQWAMLAALGVIATLGHVLITKAYEHGEASLLAPLAFTEIVMATVLGYAFFGDLPDRWTVLGVTILVASAVYISVRERQVKGR